MTKYREILRLHSQGISQRGIAASCQCSRNTVSAVIKRADECGISWPFQKDMSDGQLQELMFPEKALPTSRKIPDCEYIHKEMAKSGVTLSLLWNEYCEECRLIGEIPLMYSQFCRYYHRYANTKKATMYIHRKPGEQMEVDWAGQTAEIVDRNTGDVLVAYVFVAVLSCSQYAYVEAFLSQNQENWIAAHVNAYKFFGGITRILVPDNLKTGVDRISWYTPTINKTYHEMAEHYGTAVIPARVRKPKDKPNVEGAVGIISTWIIAAIRKQQFFSLRELNTAIHEKLSEFNRKPFQKKPGSRLSVFLEEEKHALMPLPATPYELALWKTATVQFNYHISVEKMHYSVPYEYIKHKVDVRMTRTVIEVFFNNHRIASHIRKHGRVGQYSTIVEHMPEDHKSYTTWNAERFISWATGIGPNTAIAIKSILSAHKIQQQGYKSCMGLLKLVDKYSVLRLEEACKKALSYTPQPSYKSIQTILKTGQDKLFKEADPAPTTKENTANFGFTRGAGYYGGNE
ncbi:transposase y4bL/y4kJ/y4tB [Clostridium aceticum]|uniref:Transposase y4bL/y4kJ/y4tB n=1 Tax=Clostridium aceticum TaxID=84022 RepID=A0A0D8I538_9CLOT|nr:IS21 family transposase [Clostridium aceticum]AKL93673.1 putative transposase y4bL/y4kJ/y4tB [Clostridium aceticum]AKL95760.1 transposase y4bL/y4kJ/y4tB [Clostridium aceticum]KJF25390.1 integrase [Clostridium aceticum]